MEENSDLPLEIIKEILSELDARKLQILSERYEQFSFLEEKSFLDSVAVKNKLPFGDSLKELKEFEELSDVESFERLLVLFPEEEISLAIIMSLIAASKANKIKIVELIVEKYKKLTKKHEIYRGCLHAINRAAENGHSEIVKLLLLEEVKISHVEMGSAIKGGNKEIINLFEELGISIEEGEQFLKMEKKFEEAKDMMKELFSI